MTVRRSAGVGACAIAERLDRRHRDDPQIGRRHLTGEMHCPGGAVRRALVVRRKRRELRGLSNFDSFTSIGGRRFAR
jgi:hypothetical protein